MIGQTKAQLTMTSPTTFHDVSMNLPKCLQVMTITTCIHETSNTFSKYYIKSMSNKSDMRI